MDGNRFDAMSRSFAERASRRGMLRRLGEGGLGAALLGVAGVRAADAQGNSQGKTCALTLVATVAVGPNKSHVYEGKLTMVIGSDGAIDDGSLATVDGKTYDLVGQTTGRALNLRITTANGQYLSLTGTGQQDIVLCRGSIDGTFGGPHTGDLGTWYAAKQKRTSEATPTTGSGGNGGNTSNGNGTSGGNTAPTEAPTITPTPCDSTGVNCGSTFVLDPATCQCVCPQPYTKCGDSSCCFGGSICNNDGSCNCPQGMEPCQEVCTQSCPSGQYLDPNTCKCGSQSSCGQGETLCNGQCVSIACPANQLFDNASCQCINRCSPGQDYCNGSCIDVVNDAANCGTCGNACPTGMPCIAGTCECPVSYSYCQSQQKCLAEGSSC
jgi:hypothetical protein